MAMLNLTSEVLDNVYLWTPDCLDGGNVTVPTGDDKSITNAHEQDNQ